MSKYPTLYRVFDTIGPEGLELHWQEFVVIAETPMSWYVLPKESSHLTEISGFEDSVKRQRKLVLKDQIGRRFCYVDKRRAMDSYRLRKHWQLSHAAMSKARGKAGLAAAERLLAAEGEIALPCTEPSKYIQGLKWGEC